MKLLIAADIHGNWDAWSALAEDYDEAYLRDLPQHVRTVRDDVRFYLTHATPSDPLYGRQSPDSEAWAAELAAIDADVLLVGHSHVPFVRRFGEKVVLNPGSIGQPRTGDALSRYAIWQDGKFELKSFSYPVAATIGKLRALALPRPVEVELVRILETGVV